jgi:hypothetical protein
MKEYYNVSPRNRMGGAEWIDVAQDMDKWLALVKTGMNFKFFICPTNAHKLY